MPYDTLDEAIAFINARPRPLALYCLRPRAAPSGTRLLRRTHSGGVTVNDWGWHVFNHDLPFGGIGNSGMGTYHGEEGFRELSHAKAVFKRHRWFPIGLFYPPYGNLVQRLSMKFYLGKAAGSHTMNDMSFDYVVVGRRLGRLRGRVAPERGPDGVGLPARSRRAGQERAHPRAGRRRRDAADPAQQLRPTRPCRRKGLNGRRGYQPRGKALGGSSSINAMLYVRGHRYDYDHWAALGNAGWSYDEVLPYFKRAENNEQFDDALPRPERPAQRHLLAPRRAAQPDVPRRGGACNGAGSTPTTTAPSRTARSCTR